MRRVNISFNHILYEYQVTNQLHYEQLDLFTNYNDEKQVDQEFLDKEKNLQKAILSIKKKYGKSSVLKGMNLQEGETTKDRNNQIGGHKA